MSDYIGDRLFREPEYTEPNWQACMSERVEAANEIARLRLEGMRMSSMLWDIHAICNNWNYFPFQFVKSIQRRARYGLGRPDVEKL